MRDKFVGCCSVYLARFSEGRFTVIVRSLLLKFRKEYIAVEAFFIAQSCLTDTSEKIVFRALVTLGTAVCFRFILSRPRLA